MLIGNGGGSSKNIGFILKVHSPGVMFITILTLDGDYRTGSNIGLEWSAWVHLVVTFSFEAGMDIYQNGCKVIH